MSRYTTELRYMIENPQWTDERLGLTQYPIFDEGYRDTLNSHIKKYFYFAEIGFETPARFAMRLKDTMDLIMPYYNQLYESARASINPFITMRYDVKGNEKLQELIERIKDYTKDSAGDTTTDTVKDTTGKSTTDATKATAEGGTQGDITHTTDVTNTEGHENGTSLSDTIDKKDEKTGTTESGNESSKVVYDSQTADHGFSVHSDTPEGFMATSSIEANTYASSAEKTQNTSKHTGSDTTTTTFGKKVDGTYTTNNDSKTTGEHETNTRGKTESTGERDDTITFGKTVGETSHSETETVGKETGHGTVNDIIKDIIHEIENTERNLNRDTWTGYDGFNSTTMSEMLLKWRDTFINIDRMIIHELESLFIQILN